MDDSNKVLSMQDRLGRVIDEDDNELDQKAYDFTRDGEGGSGSGNELWGEEIKAWADMLTIESLFYTEDWVYIVTDLVANKISSQPLYVMKRTLTDGVEAIDYADGHPLNALIESPNPMQDYHAWMYATATNLTLLGNAVEWYSKANNWLVSLRTSLVDIRFGTDNRIAAYSYSSVADDSAFIRDKKASLYDPESIIHIRRPNPSSMIWGLSPFVPGRKSILFNRYSTDYLNSFYLKQATPGMIVEVDKQMNEQQALRQLRSFELAYTGRKNQRRTMLLPKGMKATPVTHTISDQKLVDLINMNRETVVNLLKVPKHEVGLQSAGSLGSEEYKTALRNFWESTLIPTCRMIEGSLNKYFKAMLGPDYFFQFDLTDVEALKDDQMKKASIAKEMLAAGLSVNEVRTKVWDVEATADPKDNVPYVSQPKAPALLPAATAPAASPGIVTDPLADKPATEAPEGGATAPAAGDTAAEAATSAEVASQAVTTPQQSLNGAQVTSLVEVVNQVAQGLIPRETGVEILRVAFALSKEDAEAVMGSVGRGFAPTAEGETAATNTAPPPAATTAPSETVTVQTDPLKPAETGKVIEAEAPSGTAKLLSRLAASNTGWVDTYVKTVDEVVNQKQGKRLKLLALETLVSMTEAAAPILKRNLRDVKAADVPSKTKLRKDLNKAFDKFEAEWVTEFAETLTSTVELGYDQQLDFVINKPDKEKIEALRARDEKGRRELLQERGLESFANISKTHTERIMAEITRGVDAGETIQQITKRVADTFANPEEMSARADTIARTETLTAVSIGQGAAFKNASETIPGLRKAWLNADDGRVRDTHKDTGAGGVSGEVVEANEAFSNGLRWPRDVTSGDPAEVINCRCTLVTLLPGEDLEV